MVYLVEEVFDEEGTMLCSIVVPGVETWGWMAVAFLSVFLCCMTEVLDFFFLQGFKF
jgi:hypothetical protein